MKRFFGLLFTVFISGHAISGQVLQRDSLALAAFYDDTFGTSWIKNDGWLTAPVGQWYGVGLDPGGQVISLKLPNNGLQGAVGNSIQDLVSLHVLDISGNQIRSLPPVFNEMEISVVDVGQNLLTDLPNYSLIDRTFTLFVNDNQLDFADLEVNAQLPGLVYHPQQPLGTPTTMVTSLGSTNMLSALVGGGSNTYQWYLNEEMIPGGNDAIWSNPNIQFDDLGDYHCQVTNDLLPDLVLSTSTTSIEVPTEVQGIIVSEEGAPVPANINFYRMKGETLQSDILSSTSPTGYWITSDLYMGYYIVKVFPMDLQYAPYYLGEDQLFWDEATIHTFDGSQKPLNSAVQPLESLNGTSEITGTLLALIEDYLEVTVYLFAINDNDTSLVAFDAPDENLNFAFQNLPSGTYKVQYDIPGTHRGNPEFVNLEEGASIALEINPEVTPSLLLPQQSVARNWNEILLQAIRRDFARPTVHARNLFHLSAAMYDVWALYDNQAVTYLMGNAVHDFNSFLESFPLPEDLASARHEAISYAAYRLLKHRFQKSPNTQESQALFRGLLLELGYDPDHTSVDYTSGDPAALGNFVAQTYINFGLQDGSNEQNGYINRHYEPVNEPLVPAFPGNPGLSHYNQWQPLSLDIFIDQSGNVIPRNTPEFLSPEWGSVAPFALRSEDATIVEKELYSLKIFQDPGPPPLLDLQGDGPTEEAYKWGFSLVSIWSSHMDPGDGVMWDVSPASLGNNPEPPANYDGYADFFEYMAGGDASVGHTLNPTTGLPYVPQVIPRGDYTRVIAEYWADGPDSETPPGHWFTILNSISDHPVLVKKMAGSGRVLDPLEWDIKAYFMLGGAMHDAAISAWSIKGYYDYIRPISAIRAMADLGQCTDPLAPSFHTDGISLVPGYIELVGVGDDLAGSNQQHLGKVKLKAWRGPDYIINPENFAAEVNWILAENWWPYQRPSFVTPPFAGYVSGHSTFSRAAAELLTQLTGDPFFPGGIGEFTAKKDEFLVFEEGPSVDVTLQWATYRDASDETSLSRIWGGIHPPADDLPGRKIGEAIGKNTFTFTKNYFDGSAKIAPTNNIDNPVAVYPVPASHQITVQFKDPGPTAEIGLYNFQGKLVRSSKVQLLSSERFTTMDLSTINPGFYLVKVRTSRWENTHKILVSR